MKITGRTILGLGLVGYALYYFAKKTTDAIVFGTPKIGNRSIKLLNWDFWLALPITNNNPFSIEITGVDLKVYYGDKVISDLKNTGKLTLESKKTVELRMDGTMSFLQIGADVISIIKSQDFSQKVRIKGTVSTGAVNWPVNTLVDILPI